MSETIEDYRQRIAICINETDRIKKLNNQYSFARLFIFLLLITIVSFAIKFNIMVIAVIAFIGFLIMMRWVIIKQLNLENLKNYFHDLRVVNENEIDSIANQTSTYYNGSGFINDKHNYTSDLDIFGKVSLFQLVNRCATNIGVNKLASWLKNNTDINTILKRQEAVKEISNDKDWKLNFQANLLFSKDEHPAIINQLFIYLTTPIIIPGEAWLKKYIRIAPYMFLIAFLLFLFYNSFWFLPLILAVYNLNIVGSKKDLIKKVDLVAERMGKVLEKYADVFAKIEQRPWISDYITTIIEPIHKRTISIRIKELSVLIDKLNYHLNLVVAVTLNAVFIWDVKQLIAIEHWKRGNNDDIEYAFKLIGELEALISLSSLHTNYPLWVFPEIASDEGYTIEGKNIAHPLIDEKVRVGNDYELNNSFRIDIITGSNMAGKSTFLRTLGINTVLALCGAPVCANEMKVSVVSLFTYMRIRDSLNESTSTFKAELDRLQSLLEIVGTNTKVFFLIDEILRGTNSVDKYLGSKAVVKRLIEKRGVGMLATHDLQIADMEQMYPEYISNHYFDIQVIEGEMVFDYKLKEGECKTFNASILLKQIGINTEE